MRNVYKVIKSGNEWHVGVDRRGFGTKQDFIPLFFFMNVRILWQGQKAVLTIVEFEFFDIFYSKFQIVSTFSICSKFCVENWLLYCDLICKWVHVTCKSGCKRFWKSALHIFHGKIMVTASYDLIYIWFILGYLYIIHQNLPTTENVINILTHKDYVSR